MCGRRDHSLERRVTVTVLHSDVLQQVGEMVRSSGNIGGAVIRKNVVGLISWLCQLWEFVCYLQVKGEEETRLSVGVSLSVPNAVSTGCGCHSAPSQ